MIDDELAKAVNAAIVSIECGIGGVQAEAIVELYRRLGIANNSLIMIAMERWKFERGVLMDAKTGELVGGE